MRALFLNSHAPAGDWQRAIATGFIALTLLGAAVDRRNAVIDRSFAGSRAAVQAVVPLTNLELVREMMTHD